MVSGQPLANRISVNAAEQDEQIEAVTVYQANHAEVKRRVKVELKKGQNYVNIERLPSCVMEDSIRVDGTGNAVIFDVVYHKLDTRARSSTDEGVVQTRRVLEALRKERDVANEQSNFLNSYGKTLDSKSVGIEDVERFLDMFAPRQITIAKRIQELNIQIAAAEKDANQEQARAYADIRGSKRETKLTVTVLAEMDGEAEIMLTYVVSNASWTPAYDVRASIAESPDAPSVVALHYRASVSQTTGENWPEVSLTLSTASPQLGSVVPKLSPWRIGFRPPEIPEEEKEESDDDMGFGLFDGGGSVEVIPRAMAIRQTQVTNQGVLNASFGIPGRSDVPSDEGSHKVVIAILEFTAELEWICVPREKESVFLTCKTINTSQFTLLPGEASVFVNGNFVSNSQIPHVTPSDSFKTPLGIDSALRISYPSLRTLNRTTTQSSFNFLAKDTRQSITTYSQHITVRNSRPGPLHALRILDHVPVSTDTLIKIKLISPAGLGSVVGILASENAGSGQSKTLEHLWANVQKNVKARWANLDVGGEGTIEWVCDVGAGEEIQLELAWETSAPIGKSWRQV